MGISVAKIVMYTLSATVSFWIGMHLGFSGVGRELPTLTPSVATTLEDCSSVQMAPGDEIEEPCPGHRLDVVKQVNEEGCPIPELKLPVLHKSEGASTAMQIFPLLHHPGSLVCTPAEVILTHGSPWVLNGTSADTPFALSPCKSVYMTRTGSRASTPNKCAAIVSVPEGSTSPYFQTIRRGVSAGIKEAYQKDFATKEKMMTSSYTFEKTLLEPTLRDLETLRSEFLAVMGDPMKPDGSRRTVTIMVVNSGTCVSKITPASLDVSSNIL